jgi:integrase
MPNVKFYLRDKKSDNETLIVLVFRFHNNKLSYSTQKSIHPSQWDSEKQRAIISKSAINLDQNKDINSKLSQLKNDLESTYNEFDFNRIIPTVVELKNVLDKKQKRVEVIAELETITLAEYINKYITSCESGAKLTNKGKRYKYGSISAFISFQNHFTNYCSKKNKIYDFNDIDLSFYSDFILYLTDKEFFVNTIGKQIKTLKTILNSASIEGINKNLAYKDKNFKILDEETYQIYLREDELDKLWKLDLAAKPTYERTRDLFLIGAYTALRYSDYSSIVKDNITEENKKKYITVFPEKTSHKVVIPLKPIVISILDKYNYNLPKPISNQKSNEYLKLIGGLAEIISKEIFPITKGGKSEMITKLKHELITTHTARRSAATNMFKAGLRAFEIMKITGHKTEHEFFKYIKISQEENAIKLSEHSFFN